jgi:hypothetical protein
MVAFAVIEEPPLTMSAPILFILYQRIYDLVFRLECELHKRFPCSFIIGAMKVQFVREDPTFEKQLDSREVWKTLLDGCLFRTNCKDILIVSRFSIQCETPEIMD